MRAGNAEALEGLIRGPAEGRASWQMGAPRSRRRRAAARRGRRAGHSRATMFDIPLLDLPPLSGASGTVRLPGSKSISNRVLLLAGLAAGTTRVHDLLDSDDTRVMLARCARWAAACERKARVLHVTGSVAGWRCTRPRCSSATPVPRCGRWRRRWRCWPQPRAGASNSRGVPRMHERPIGDLVDALRPLGCASTPSAIPAARRGQHRGRPAAPRHSS